MAIKLSELKEEIDKVLGKIRDNSFSSNKQIAQLARGSDWAFVIKSQALIESSLTRLLVAKVNDIGFLKLFDKMSVSQKISLLKDLNLLESCEYKFIQNISELRNKLAHDPNEIDFTFKKYLKKLNEKDKLIFINKYYFSHSNEPDKKFMEMFNKYPKVAIWISLVPLLTLINSKEELIRLSFDIDEKSSNTNEKLLKDLHPDLFINQLEK